MLLTLGAILDVLANRHAAFWLDYVILSYSNEGACIDDRFLLVCSLYLIALDVLHMLCLVRDSLTVQTCFALEMNPTLSKIYGSSDRTLRETCCLL